MAMGQNFQEAVPFSDTRENYGTSPQKCKSEPATVDKVEDGVTGCFDCNICLDLVHDPVVTLCGHLYCWPCIYKWIHYQSLPTENLDHQPPQCPVCKALVSTETLVPLYSRGLTTKASEAKVPHVGMVIPQRPSTTRCQSHAHTTTRVNTSTRPAQQLHHRNNQNQPQPYYSFPSAYSAAPMLSLSSTTATNPVVGVFGEMVYARLFGNPETTLYNPNSYNIIVNSNPRYRRHLMEADKSLGRFLFFLCCCMVLCLLLF